MAELSALAGVVTGGARGIGAGICQLLAGSGAGVVSMDRAHPDGPQDTSVRRVTGSVAVRAEVAAVVARCRSECGSLDFMVANAGVVSSTPFLDLSDGEWNDILAVNLTGVFYCVQEAARVMVRDGRPGSIVVMSSINAWWAEPRTAHYNAAKAATIGLVRSAARELAPYGVRVNAVCPGMVQTPLTAPITIDSPRATDYLASIPMGRYATPEDVARLVRFLVSDESSYLTGAALTIDGGQTLGTDFRQPPSGARPVGEWSS